MPPVRVNRALHLFVVLLGVTAPFVMLQSPRPAHAAMAQANEQTMLYNGSGSPNEQGFLYLTQPFGSASATQIGTNLDTTPKKSDQAGFFVRSSFMPQLDSQKGYVLHFAVRLNAENHAGSDKNGDNKDDRAGFSLILLDQNTNGIEVGFWADRIWAQEDGTAEPPAGTLFTHAEEGLWNTTQSTVYDLDIRGETYTLSSGNTTIITGKLRNYSAFNGTVNPYRTPNFLFFGDDTSSASANVDFTGPITIGPSVSMVYLPLANKS